MRLYIALLALTGLALGSSAAAQESGTGAACPEIAAGKAPRESSSVVLMRALSESFRNDVLEAVRAAGESDPHGLVIIVLSDARAKPDIILHDVALPPTVVTQAVEQAIPRLAIWPGRGPIRLLVRLDVGASRPCPGAKEEEPSLINIATIRSILTSAASQGVARNAGGGAPTSGMLDMVVARDGTVVYSQLNGSSADQILRDATDKVARRARFRPAKIDGTAVDVWVRLPIQMSYQ